MKRGNRKREEKCWKMDLFYRWMKSESGTWKNFDTIARIIATGVFFATIFQTNWVYGEPMVTRWMHPDNIPKPTHQPLHINEPLDLKLLQSSEPSGKEPYPPASGRICLIVNASLQAGIAASLNQYQTDLANAGYAVVTYLLIMAARPKHYAHIWQDCIISRNHWSGPC